MPENRRIDVLRTLAITPVVLAHLMMITGIWPSDYYRAVSMNAYYGVTLFFVISGFLITDRALARYGSLDRINPRTFYGARARRILPALFLMMTLTIGCSAIGVPGFAATLEKTVSATFSVLTFQANYAFISKGLLKWWHPLWSLAIEETFYIVYPLALRIVRARTTIIALLVVLIVEAPIARSMMTVKSVFVQIGCIDAISAGCLLALLKDRYFPRGLPTILSALALSFGLFFFGVALFGPYLQDNYVVGPSTAIAGSFLLTAWASSSNGRLIPFIVTIPGRLCYEIYLIHWPAGIIAFQLGLFSGKQDYDFEWSAALFYGLVVVAAWAMSLITGWLIRATQPSNNSDQVVQHDRWRDHDEAGRRTGAAVRRERVAVIDIGR